MMRKVLIIAAYASLCSVTLANDDPRVVRISANKVFACKTINSLKIVYRLAADHDETAMKNFTKDHPDDCKIFHDGMVVSVDDFEGKLYCVRQYGDYRCLWVPEQAFTVYDISPPDVLSGFN